MGIADDQCERFKQMPQREADEQKWDTIDEAAPKLNTFHEGGEIPADRSDENPTLDLQFNPHDTGMKDLGKHGVPSACVFVAKYETISCHLSK